MGSRLTSIDYEISFEADKQTAEDVSAEAARMVANGDTYGVYDDIPVRLEQARGKAGFWAFRITANADSDWEAGYEGFIDPLRKAFPEIKFGARQVGESWS